MNLYPSFKLLGFHSRHPYSLHSQIVLLTSLILLLISLISLLTSLILLLISLILLLTISYWRFKNRNVYVWTESIHGQLASGMKTLSSALFPATYTTWSTNLKNIRIKVLFSFGKLDRHLLSRMSEVHFSSSHIILITSPTPSKQSTRKPARGILWWLLE